LWVYRSDLVPPGEAAAGSLVHVHDERGRHLGSALYSSASQIAVRLLTGDEIREAELPTLLGERIAAAVRFRQQIARDTDSYRVIFSEADLLPGLILDKTCGRRSSMQLPNTFPRPASSSASIPTFANWSNCRRASRNWCVATAPAPSSA